jgi:hypothetical protein
MSSHRTQLLKHHPRFLEAAQILTELDELSIRILARRTAVNPDVVKISGRPVLLLQAQSKRLSKQENVILGLPASRVLHLSDQLRQSSSTLGGMSRELGEATRARSRSQAFRSLLQHVRETPESKEAKEILIGSLHRFARGK